MTQPAKPTIEDAQRIRDTQGIGILDARRKLWEKYVEECLYWLREQVEAEPQRVAQHFGIYLDLMLDANAEMKKLRNAP